MHTRGQRWGQMILFMIKPIWLTYEIDGEGARLRVTKIPSMGQYSNFLARAARWK